MKLIIRKHYEYIYIELVSDYQSQRDWAECYECALSLGVTRWQ